MQSIAKQCKANQSNANSTTHEKLVKANMETGSWGRTKLICMCFLPPTCLGTRAKTVPADYSDRSHSRNLPPRLSRFRTALTALCCLATEFVTIATCCFSKTLSSSLYACTHKPLARNVSLDWNKQKHNAIRQLNMHSRYMYCEKTETWE